MRPKRSRFMSDTKNKEKPRCVVCDEPCRSNQYSDKHGVYFDTIGCCYRYPEILAKRQQTASDMAEGERKALQWMLERMEPLFDEGSGSRAFTKLANQVRRRLKKLQSQSMEAT